VLAFRERGSRSTGGTDAWSWCSKRVFDVRLLALLIDLRTLLFSFLSACPIPSPRLFLPNPFRRPLRFRLLTVTPNQIH